MYILKNNCKTKIVTIIMVPRDIIILVPAASFVGHSGQDATHQSKGTVLPQNQGSKSPVQMTRPKLVSDLTS